MKITKTAKSLRHIFRLCSCWFQQKCAACGCGTFSAAADAGLNTKKEDKYIGGYTNVLFHQLFPRVTPSFATGYFSVANPLWVCEKMCRKSLRHISAHFEVAQP